MKTVSFVLLKVSFSKLSSQGLQGLQAVMDSNMFQMKSMRSPSTQLPDFSSEFGLRFLGSVFCSYRKVLLM